jgi:hypothetical protein
MGVDRAQLWRRATLAALVILALPGLIAATTLSSSGAGARHHQPHHPAAERPAEALTRP